MVSLLMDICWGVLFRLALSCASLTQARMSERASSGRATSPIFKAQQLFFAGAGNRFMGSRSLLAFLSVQVSTVSSKLLSPNRHIALIKNICICTWQFGTELCGFQGTNWRGGFCASPRAPRFGSSRTICSEEFRSYDEETNKSCFRASTATPWPFLSPPLAGSPYVRKPHKGDRHAGNRVSQSPLRLCRRLSAVPLSLDPSGPEGTTVARRPWHRVGREIRTS